MASPSEDQKDGPGLDYEQEYHSPERYVEELLQRIEELQANFNNREVELATLYRVLEIQAHG